MSSLKYGFPLIWLLAVACGAPEPISIVDLEATDHRFVSTTPRNTGSPTLEILKKESLTLQDVLMIADAMNPQLASERKNIDLAQAAVWEAKLYPNPSLILAIEDYRTRDGKSDRKGGVSFPLVVSGRIGSATSLAEKEREIAAVNYVWRRREILSDVKRAFIGILASRRNTELSRETRDLAKTLHEVTNERFKAEAIPEMEVLKAAVSLAKAEIDLKLAEKDLAAGTKTLHAFMGNIDFPTSAFAGELATRFVSPSLEALRGQVTAVHPLLEAVNKAKEAAELQLDLAKAERIPDLGLELTAGRSADADTILALGISVPLPLFNRNQAKIVGAEIRIQQAELQIQAVRNDLVLRLTESYRNFSAAQERVGIYMEEILPKAEKAFTQTNEGYRLGKFGYLDLLDAQRTLGEAKIAFAAALADLNLASSELEKLTGARLEAVR